MSIINQMLKDLDKQHKPNTHSVQGIMTGVAYRPQTGYSLSKQLFMVAGILLLIGAIASWFILAKSSQPSSTRLSAAQAHVQHPKPALPAKAKLVAVPALPKHVNPAKSAKQAKPEIHKTFVAQTPEEKAQAQLAEAMTAVDQGQFMTAQHILQHLLKNQPGFDQAREVLIALYADAANDKQALSLLKAGLRIHPGNAHFAQLNAQILLQQHKPEAALALLAKHPPQLNQNPEYFAVMAAAYQQLEQFDLAAALYESLVHVQPGNGVYWMGLGLSLEQMNQNNAAGSAYQKAAQTGSLDGQLLSFVNNRLQMIKGMPL